MLRVRRASVIDIVTKVLVETSSKAGYRIDVAADGHGRYLVTAVAHRGSERFVVRGPDPYTAVVELAGQVWIELEDG